ncbi:hypothetical protein ALNOE001_04670 [Candidatus Methanobinarius endosymbioticus]|uniref:H/ACA RNA-protein complex component Gar1 n=1 Tax=Candidatus Methanobinarius endosymbioticus TaxID=2006182 RepID=A0A366MET8_9EURY|nr:hypothetical protein ALNOE001_04670 [Candidatus Methanobinarius endosymbioticus]
MKFLGNISHLSNSGRLIARSSQSPPTGASVFSNDKKKIGKIVEIFGPTKEPYISIGIFKSIDSENFKDRFGEDLFVSENPKNKKDNRKNNNKNNKKYNKNNRNNNKNSKSNNKNKSNRRGKNRSTKN